MESLPLELVNVILVTLCRPYEPAWRSVCRAWCAMSHHASVYQRDPRTIFLECRSGHALVLYELAENNHRDLLEWIMRSVRKIPHWSMEDADLLLTSAAAHGHLDLVKHCLSVWEATDLKGALNNASRRGHLHVVQYLLAEYDAAIAAAQQGQTTTHHARDRKGWIWDIEIAYASFATHNWRTLLDEKWERAVFGFISLDEFSARSTHLELNTADAVLRDTLGNAARAGHFELVEYLYTRAQFEYTWKTRRCLDHALSCAANGGHSDIADLCVRLGARDFLDALVMAAESGHVDIVRQCYNWWGSFPGGDPVSLRWHLEDAMQRAASRGHIAVIVLCKELGALHAEEALNHACGSGNLPMIKLLVSLTSLQSYASCFLRAAVQGELDELRYWYENHASCREDLTLTDQAIDVAAPYGETSIIRQCLEWGLARPEKTIPLALRTAATSRYGWTNVVRLLLQQKRYRCPEMHAAVLELSTTPGCQWQDIRELCLAWLQQNP